MARLAQCEAPCLFTAGRGAFDSVRNGRLRKTREFFEDPDTFMEGLAQSIERLVRRAERIGMIPVVRLNGTSDIAWERVKVPSRNARNIFEAFPSIQFYDYTKISKRTHPAYRARLPVNYDLTFSYSGAPAFQRYVTEAIAHKARVAVVFRHRERIPASFMGMQCVDGDDTDLRFLDPAGCVVALYAKGKGKRDAGPFIVDN
jgi:hypothetical protein